MGLANSEIGKLSEHLTEQTSKLEKLLVKRKELEAALHVVHSEIGILEAALGGAVNSSW